MIFPGGLAAPSADYRAAEYLLLAHHAVDLLVTRIAKFSLPSRHREVPVN